MIALGTRIMMKSMINISKELMSAMVEKRDAIAAHEDTSIIDLKLNALKDFKTKIIEFQTSGSGKTYDAKAELDILKSLIKQRKNSLDEYKNAGRDDLAKGEAVEIETLEKLLPELPNESTIGSTYLEWRQNSVSSLEFPYITKKEMGNAIRSVSEKFALVDKALVSKVIKEYVSE
jgi:uncharacterized protein YqeY